MEEIKTVIEQQQCVPFIAQQKISGSNPYENIMSAIWRSDAIFAILTENALTKQSTRDWIYFELGFAKGVWSKQKKYLMKNNIFAWKDPKIKLPRANPLEFITSYHPLVKRSRKSRNQMLEEMKEISVELWNIYSSETATTWQPPEKIVLTDGGVDDYSSDLASPHAFSVKWRLSGAVMPAPPYGTMDIPYSDSASYLIVQQLEGEDYVKIICDMRELRPKSRYRVAVIKPYALHSTWPGRFSDTIPPLSFVTDSKGCGVREFNLRSNDFPNPGAHILSMWLNQLDPNYTILISDNFEVNAPS